MIDHQQIYLVKNQSNFTMKPTWVGFVCVAAIDNCLQLILTRYLIGKVRFIFAHITLCNTFGFFSLKMVWCVIMGGENYFG